MPQPVVLLVDDDPDVLSGLSLALRKGPFLIRRATSAEQALDAMEEEKIDLVITDQTMPGMKGVEFLAFVRDRHPDTIRFMLTGNASLDLAMEAVNQGAVSRFLVKPCAGAELLIAVREALQRQELMHRAGQLVGAMRHRDALIREMERTYPGITKVARSATGEVEMATPAKDYDALMKEITDELGGE